MNETKISVLVVDDAAMNRNLIRTILNNEGFCVSVAENGEQVVALCKEVAFDVVLMDVNLPGINGVEATRQIRSTSRQNRNQLVIIGLTAHASTRDREQFLNAGMDDCLAKPVDFQDLVSLIHRLVSGNTSAADSRADRAPAQKTEPKVLDLNDAMTRLKSNRELFLRLIIVFREEIPALVDAADQAARESNLQKLGDTAHRIRGMSANLGAQSLCESARRLEASCEAESQDQARAQWANVKHELVQLEEALVRLGY